MVNIKAASESSIDVESADMTDRVSLNAGQIIENVEIIDVKGAVSDYGPFMALTLKADDGEKFHIVCGESNVFGKNCIKEFADISEEDGTYSIKPKYVGKKIWIMKDNPKQPKKGGKPYMAMKCGFME